MGLINRGNDLTTRLRKRVSGASSSSTNGSGRLVETASMPSYSSALHLPLYNFIVELLWGKNLLKTNSVLCLDSRERTAIQFQNRSDGLVALGNGEYGDISWTTFRVLVWGGLIGWERGCLSLNSVWTCERSVSVSRAKLAPKRLTKRTWRGFMMKDRRSKHRRTNTAHTVDNERCWCSIFLSTSRAGEVISLADKNVSSPQGDGRCHLCPRRVHR